MRDEYKAILVEARKAAKKLNQKGVEMKTRLYTVLDNGCRVETWYDSSSGQRNWVTECKDPQGVPLGEAEHGGTKEIGEGNHCFAVLNFGYVLVDGDWVATRGSRDAVIYEVPVYCGRMKEFRVLNLTTGTVYSGANETMTEANASIKQGEQRSGKGVIRTSLAEIVLLLELNRKTNLMHDFARKK